VLYNGIANVTLWRVLRKRLHLKEYKLERWAVGIQRKVDKNSKHSVSLEVAAIELNIVKQSGIHV
jgi:hypothetical protein